MTGTVDNAGVISLAGAGQFTLLRFAGPSATLVGGGAITLSNNVENNLLSTGAPCTLTNVDNRISGAGVIGFGDMSLVNDTAGAIVAVGSSGLTINTGSTTIVNDGLIEADRTDLKILSALNNDGRLYVLGGDLILERTVSGTGEAQINAGTLIADGQLGEDVDFVGGAGVLVLAHSQDYANTVHGFSGAGGTSLDLRDIGFVSTAEATFSGSASGGVLTVTDGTHTALIHLSGSFSGSTFVASSDGQGGVTVATEGASPRSFVDAMAGMAAKVGGSLGLETKVSDRLLPMLANGR